MKKIYLFAAAVALFAACSSNDLVPEQQQASQQQGDGVPVAFDSYVNRGITRAGLADANVVTTDLEAAGVGFGVFGFYTNADNYDQNFKPNFMYNEHVTKSGTWSYAPVKYWPNEFGTTALSDDMDKVSFFAYAPYVTVNPTSGKVNGDGTTYTADDGDITMGIVGMKKNNDTGDPMVKYISTFYTDKQVDLLWGTQTGTWNIKQTGAGQTDFTPGKPWLNVQHPQATQQRLMFDFKHALAALNVTVDTKVNSTSVTALEEPANTKVFVRSVTFEGFDVKGALNLNNVTDNTALWYNFDCVEELNNGSEVTIKDGRKDGKEGLTAATKEYAAINPDFVQDNVWASLTAPGVTETPRNLFCTSASATPTPDAPILVIPNGDKLKVTIEYDVLTADANLAKTLNDGVTPGSVVKNTITRYITTSGAGSTSTGDITLANGLQYTINLHLGLNSVEFDASVTAWDTPANEGGADLPHNTAAAVTAGGSIAANIGAAGGTYNFTFTGGTGTLVRKTGDAADGATVSGSGTSGTITIPANTTTSEKTYTVNVQDATSPTPQEVTVTITQAPHALGLAYASATATSITVTTSSELTDAFKTDLTGATISVVDEADTSTELYSSVTGLVITTSTLTTGHTYKVTVTANNVTESFSQEITLP